jgi:hypothetical protein
MMNRGDWIFVFVIFFERSNFSIRQRGKDKKIFKKYNMNNPALEGDIPPDLIESITIKKGLMIIGYHLVSLNP